MEIRFTDREQALLEELLNAKQENMALGAMFNEVFETKIDDIKRLKQSHKKEDDYLKCLIDYLELDYSDSENVKFIDSYIKPAIKFLFTREFKNNPYYKNINIKNVKDGNYELKYLKYSPFQVFPYEDIKVQDNNFYHEISSIAFFDEEFPYLALLDKDEVWMCITPNEMKTMEDSLSKAKGNVLVYGLGLGYYAYMASIKGNVSSVTVIEKDQTIISLFKKYLLPHFEHKEKIKIINTDAFEFNHKDLSMYNFAFVDLWHNPEDGLPIYMKFKKEEKLHKNIEYTYWIEKSLIAMYRRCYLSVIEEYLDGISGKAYLKAKTPIDEIINAIYFKIKNKTFMLEKEIESDISDSNIKKLISE